MLVKYPRLRGGYTEGSKGPFSLRFMKRGNMCIETARVMKKVYSYAINIIL